MTNIERFHFPLQDLGLQVIFCEIWKEIDAYDRFSESDISLKQEKKGAHMTGTNGLTFEIRKQLKCRPEEPIEKTEEFNFKAERDV